MKREVNWALHFMSVYGLEKRVGLVSCGLDE